MKPGRQHVVVIKQIFATTRENYAPVLFEIEVGDKSLEGITEDAARYVYQELGHLLFPEKGGES